MKLARLVSIIMLLLQHRKMTASRLAEMFEVTTRTIYRDIEVINMAGIPICTTTGMNGGISIMEEYKVEKGLFTTSDITSLLIGLGSIPLSGDEVSTTIAKIKGMIPEEQMQAIEMKSQQIVVDHNPWHGRRPLKLNIREVKAALDGNRLMSFQYYDSQGRESNRQIEPYQLLLKDSNWYLHAFCTSREDFRVFRLSRMSNLKILDDTFVPREFRIKYDDLPPAQEMIIKLLVDESLRGWMADFCGNENLKPHSENSGKVLVSFPFIESDFTYGLLLSFGDKCECLGPEEIRREVKRRAADLLKLYQ